MHFQYFLYTLVTSASLFGAGEAKKKRCRTKTSSLSASTTPSISESTPSSSIIISSSLTSQTSSTTPSVSISSSTPSSTPEPSVSSTPSSAVTPSTATPSSSSTPTSTPVSSESPSSSEILSSTSTSLSTAESSTIIESSSTPSPSSAIPSSTSDAPASSTSSLPPVLATFSLRSANSDVAVVNDKSIQSRPNYQGSGFIVYVVVPAASSALWSEIPFALEEGTNRLMLSGLAGQYAFTQTSTQAIYFGNASNVNSASRSFIKCEPARQGQPLQCQAEGTTSVVFKVSRTPTTSVALLIMPDQDSIYYSKVDLVAA